MNDGAPARIETIFPASAIAERIEALAGDIAAAGFDDLLVVAVLKGSFVFAADLIRALHRAGLSPEVDFISLIQLPGRHSLIRTHRNPARHRNRCARPQCAVD